jgi:hypothetical protein
MGTQAGLAPAASAPGKALAAQPGIAQAAPQGHSGCGFSGAPGPGTPRTGFPEQMTATPISPIAVGGKMAATTGSSALRATA